MNPERLTSVLEAILERLGHVEDKIIANSATTQQLMEVAKSSYDDISELRGRLIEESSRRGEELKRHQRVLASREGSTSWSTLAMARSRDEELEALRLKTRDAMRRLRDSIDLEDFDPDEAGSEVKVTGTGIHVVIQTSGHTSAVNTEPKPSPAANGDQKVNSIVAVLSLLPLWGRVIVLICGMVGAFLGGTR